MWRANAWCKHEKKGRLWLDVGLARPTKPTMRCSVLRSPQPLAPARLRPRRSLPPFTTRSFSRPRPPPPPPPRGPAPPRAVAEGDDGGRPLSPTTLFIRLIIGALVATVATVIATPSLLSTRRGRGLLLAAINTRLSPHARLTIDAASLSWRSPPLLHGVRLTDARGIVVASADRVSASGSLAAVVAAIARWRPPWRFPLRRRHAGTPPSVDVVIDAPRLDLSVGGDSGGLTALQRALGGTPPPRVADAEGDLLSGVPSDGGGAETVPPPPFGPPVDVTFSAEARIGNARLVAARGTATLPADAAEAVGGGPVHGVLLVGADGIAADAADALSPRLEDGSAALDDNDASVSSPYTTSWIERPPRGAGAPFALEVRSPSAAVTVDGWRRARRGVELRRPAVARARLTPALARHGLTRLSPLLASGADVSSDGPVIVAIGERGARLPARRVSARVLSLTLRVRPAPRAARGPSSRGLAAAALDWLGEATGGRSGGTVVARTSGADVEVVVGGAVTCRRVDVLLSPAGKEHDASAGVHLFTYGAVDGRRCAATLGVPGATLVRAGFRGVPPHTALRVAVRGPVSHPRVDWVAASADAAALAAASAAAGGEEDGGGGAVGAVKRLLLEKAASRLRRGRVDTQTAVPPPNDLPWAPGPPRQIDAVLRGQAAEQAGGT